MIRYNFHTHTTFSDGKNTPDEMIQEAIRRGFTAIGLSDHSYTSFDEPACMQKERIDAYKTEIANLKERYSGKIQVFCGIEQDYYSDFKADGYDYIIGSVHYLKNQNGYFSVDRSPESFAEGLETDYHGDVYQMTDDYWNCVSTLQEQTGATIVGHLDLVRKFNRNNRFFDENNSRYLDAAFSAIDCLIKKGLPFEINTGAISRGYQDDPYPSSVLIRYIKEHGGCFILSSDSHAMDTLGYLFDRYENYADYDIVGMLTK